MLIEYMSSLIASVVSVVLLEQDDEPIAIEVIIK